MPSFAKYFIVTFIVYISIGISFLQSQTVYSNCPLMDSIYHGVLEANNPGETIRVIHQVTDNDKIYIFGQKTNSANLTTFFVSAFSNSSTRPIWGRTWKPASNSLRFGHLMVHDDFVYAVNAIDSLKPCISVIKMNNKGFIIWNNQYTINTGFDIRRVQNDPIITADSNMFFFV